MQPTVSRILEITFVAVIVYLVLSQASSFGSVMTSLGSAYTGAVKALQGR